MLKGEAKKEYQRDYMRVKRSNKKGLTGDGSNKEYPPIIYALADPVKRAKLEKIYESLKTFRQEKNVYYGCGKYSMPFDIVGEYLDATR